MYEMHETTFEDYLAAGKDLMENLPPTSNVRYNLYFHKLPIAKEGESGSWSPSESDALDQNQGYALFLRLEMVGDNSPFEPVDKVWGYADQAELNIKEDDCNSHIPVLSERIKDEGFPVSNFPEFLINEGPISEADLERYEMTEEDIHYILNIIHEVTKLGKRE